MSGPRVLVTGSRGLIGSELTRRLEEAGREVVSFDCVDGQDVRDAEAVARAAAGCRHVVHLAALVDPDDDGQDVMDVNVLGTWNVLRAAQDAGVERVVHVSSVNALGVFRGESQPDYLPLDDDHACRPRSVYGMSKVLSEGMCRMVSEAYEEDPFRALVDTTVARERLGFRPRYTWGAWARDHSREA